MAQNVLYIVTFKDEAQWRSCPPSLIERLQTMGDRVAFAGSFGVLADDEARFNAATAINRALRQGKEITVFGCLAGNVSRLSELLDLRKHKVQKFSFTQVRLLLGV